jgi:hypothetical protein
MIATVAEIRIEEEKEHVVNPQKHSNHVDHFAFTTTGNASSAVVALLTELQERALHHAVCWITQSPNASSVPSLIDDNHQKTPRSKWF